MKSSRAGFFRKRLRDPEPTFPHWDTLGFVAVVIFFSISGYFMPASFANADNFAVYMPKRCRRIFPGLIVCSLLMAYVIGGIFSPEPILNYLFNPSTFKTGLLFSSFMGRPIPGVFTDFIAQVRAINASLWTLPIEFTCYIILGMALSFANNKKAVLALFIISIITRMTLYQTGMDYSFYGVPMSYLSIFGIAC